MDETGQAGDADAADSGNGSGARERGPVNGWAMQDGPWSSAGAALDPSLEVPAWRRPATEIRPFTRDPRALDRPYLNGHAAGNNGSFGRNGSVNGSAASADTTETLPLDERRADADDASHWSDSRSRYADLLAHLSTPPAGPETDDGPRVDDPFGADDARTTGALPSPVSAPRFPSSAPPYPYEGDLDSRSAPIAERPAFPAVRPSTPGGRVPDRSSAEPARHARTPPTPASGVPSVATGSAPVLPGPGSTGEDQRPGDLGAVRASYDPASFPRRLPYEPPPPRPAVYEPADPSGYVAPTPYAAYPPRPAGEVDAGSPRTLPQRVPSRPDVPIVAEPPAVDNAAETPALARIATHLRRGDVFSAQERPEGFDVTAILAAVREVDGVRDASLRTTPAGANSLRLELSEGADAAEVSRRVARLLQDRMGLDAALAAPDGPGAAPLPPPSAGPLPAGFPSAGSPPIGSPPVGSPTPDAASTGGLSTGPPSAGLPEAGLPDAGPSDGGAASGGTPFVPTQAGPAGRAPVAGAGTAWRREFPDGPPAWQPAETGSTERPGLADRPGLTDRPGPTDRSGAGERPTAEFEPSPRRPLHPGDQPGPRVIIENVQITTHGVEATVEVRLTAGDRVASGAATGPAVEGYLLRLCAMATAVAVDDLLASSDHVDGPARCFVEHAASVPFGTSEVAVVVLLLACGGWVEQLAGSALVDGDNRNAMVRATLAAVNRRLDALLS